MNDEQAKRGRARDVNDGGERDPSERRSAPGGRARRLVVLTAPSGGGKTTIARRVMEAVPELRFSVSATTRPPRSHERHGVDYYFVSPERFRQYVDAGDLLEYEEVYPGVYYGTLRKEVERRSATSPILLDIDVRGAEALKRLYGDNALVIFIRPPSIEILEERLQGRATENPAARKTRLDRARTELEFAHRFDAVVVNDDFENAVAETLDLIHQFLRS